MGIMEALAKVSQADLDDIGNRISQIDAEIVAIVEPLKIERERLVNAQAVISKLLNVKIPDIKVKLLEFVAERGTVHRDEVVKEFKINDAVLRGMLMGLRKKGLNYCKETKTLSIGVVVKVKPTEPATNELESGAMTIHDYRNKIFDLITKEGSMPLPVIAARIGTSPTIVGRAVNHEWFEKKHGEVHIAR